MIKHIITILGALLTLSILSCSNGSVAGGTGVGNPTGIQAANTTVSVSGGMTVEQRSAETGMTASDINGVMFSLETVLVRVSSISWQVDYNESEYSMDSQLRKSGTELFLDGDFQFDLISGKRINGNDLAVDLPEGNYKRVRFYLEKNSDQPSIELKGSVQINESSIPFHFSIPFEIECKFDNDYHGNGLFLGDAESQIDLYFSIDQWFQNTDLISLAEMSGDSLILSPEIGALNGTNHMRNDIRNSTVLTIHR